MTTARCLLALLLLAFASVIQAAGPVSTDASTEADWQAVLALEAGPKQMEISTREQARTVILEHLAKQEAALRGFLKKHPQSPHTVDVQLQMARLFATRSDLAGDASYFDAALSLLADALATAPAERRVDLTFARIALEMHRMAAPTEQDRVRLTAEMNAFQTSYPNDRRVAALIAEVATLYEDQPARKQALLNQALAAAPSPEVRARIDDDLKRLSLLGKPIELRGMSTKGLDIDLSQYRGKVTLIYFFATWSAPSLVGLAEIENLRKTFVGEPVSIIGVSLDTAPETLEATLKANKITWPVIFDGKNWKSPLVRSLGINALPTLWMVDREGNLRTLNVRTRSEATVRALLKEKNKPASP